MPKKRKIRHTVTLPRALRGRRLKVGVIKKAKGGKKARLDKTASIALNTRNILFDLAVQGRLIGKDKAERMQRAVDKAKAILAKRPKKTMQTKPRKPKKERRI
jgi:hypothetical protein